MSTVKKGDYSSLTIPLLKEELKKRGLTVGGNKPELVARLLEHDSTTKKPKAKPSKEEAPAKPSKAKASKGDTSKAKSSKEEAPKSKAKSSKEEAPAKPKAKSSKEEAPKKTSKSEGAVPKARAKGRPKKLEVTKSQESEEEKPIPKQKTPAHSEEEKPAPKRKAKAKDLVPEEVPSPANPQVEDLPQVEIREVVVEKIVEKIIEHPKPFLDSIPPEYHGKVFKVTAEQLYEALSNNNLTGALFVALAMYEEVPIRPLWNDEIKAPVDADGYVYDEKVLMVVGRLEDGKVRNLSQKEILSLENNRILVLRRDVPAKEVSESSSETSESADSQQESEIDEGKSEGEEVEGRFDATVGTFTKAATKVFKAPMEEVKAKTSAPEVTKLNERDQKIADAVKNKKLEPKLLLRIVQSKVKDATMEDIERIRALIGK